MSENTQTGITMNQAEDLITSILRRNNIPLRAPSSGATPDVPAPEDIDTGNRKRIFKGIKQVTYEEYTNLTEEERKQYVFFVRESAEAAFGFVGIGNLKYTMVPEDIRGLDCGYFDCPVPEEPDYLTFTNLGSADTFIGLKTTNFIGAQDYRPTIYYSLDDGETWVDWWAVSSPDTTQMEARYSDIPLAPGQSVKMYGDNPNGFGTLYEPLYTSFVINDGVPVSASGNVMTLVSIDEPLDIPAAGCFQYLFGMDCQNLVSAPSLPATGLTSCCYDSMFTRCSSLENAPVLPATELAEHCYNNMFYGCTSLRDAPVLPATVMVLGCYYGMFYGCTALTGAPVLHSTSLAPTCYSDLFRECSSLVTGPGLPAEVLYSNCYRSMFYKCTSLTGLTGDFVARSFPENSASYMFYQCTALRSIPSLVVEETTGWQCCSYMFAYSGIETPPVLASTNLSDECYAYMFLQCRSLVTAPELPAQELVSNCYCNMFEGCLALNWIKCLATDISDYHCTYQWVRLLGNTGTFVKADDMNDWVVGSVDGIPAGWTVINESEE